VGHETRHDNHDDGSLLSDWRIAENDGRAVAELRSDRGWEPILHVEPEGEVEISLTAGGEYGQLTALNERVPLAVLAELLRRSGYRVGLEGAALTAPPT
jgi:hypothetical protein